MSLWQHRVYLLFQPRVNVVCPAPPLETSARSSGFFGSPMMTDGSGLRVRTRMMPFLARLYPFFGSIRRESQQLLMSFYISVKITILKNSGAVFCMLCFALRLLNRVGLDNG